MTTKKPDRKTTKPKKERKLTPIGYSEDGVPIIIAIATPAAWPVAYACGAIPR